MLLIKNSLNFVTCRLHIFLSQFSESNNLIKHRIASRLTPDLEGEKLQSSRPSKLVLRSKTYRDLLFARVFFLVLFL